MSKLAFIKNSKAFISFNDLLKKCLGKHYEPWLRKPYLVVRKGFLFFGRARIGRLIRCHLNRGAYYASSKARRIQSQIQADDVSLGLRLLLTLFYKLLVGIIRIYEQSFRQFYQGFGGAILHSSIGCEERKGVLLISGMLGPGGSERQVVLTTLGLLQRRNVQVDVAVVHMQSEFQRFNLHKLEAAGVRVIDFVQSNVWKNGIGPPGLLSAIERLPNELRDVGQYMRILTHRRPHTVHLWLDEVNIKGGLAAVATGVPRIVLSGRNLPPHNFLLYQPYMREAYRWLVRQPGVSLINNSAAGARAYEQWLELPIGSIAVVHNGFDFTVGTVEWREEQGRLYRERWGIPQHVPVVGTVIRLNEEKRPLLWAEIAAQIAHRVPDTHFIVVGDGPLRSALEARAARADLAGRLHVVGLEKQPLSAMAAMDLFLLCSRGEGLPNVLVEAQGIGVPVVTTSVGGAPETLEPGNTGCILESAKPRAAADAIATLLRDKTWLKSASSAAKVFVRNRFGMERMLDETLRIYGSVS